MCRQGEHRGASGFAWGVQGRRPVWMAWLLFQESAERDTNSRGGGRRWRESRPTERHVLKDSIVPALGTHPRSLVAKVPCKLLRKENLLREAASVLTTDSLETDSRALCWPRGALASVSFLLCKPRAMSPPPKSQEGSRRRCLRCVRIINATSA